VYDPDATGTGGQPYKYDQVTPLYGNYIVTGARFKLRFNLPSDDCYVGYVVRQDVNSSMSPAGMVYTQLMEMQGSKVAFLTATGSREVTFPTTNVPLATISGITRAQREAGLAFYGAGVGSNPAQNVLLDLWAVRPDGVAATIHYDIVIEYDVEFFNYIAPAQS
jgi:hypothetical protein